MILKLAFKTQPSYLYRVFENHAKAIKTVKTINSNKNIAQGRRKQTEVIGGLGVQYLWK